VKSEAELSPAGMLWRILWTTTLGVWLLGAFIAWLGVDRIHNVAVGIIFTIGLATLWVFAVVVQWRAWRRRAH
jgi:hypothetical protein